MAGKNLNKFNDAAYKYQTERDQVFNQFRRDAEYVPMVFNIAESSRQATKLDCPQVSNYRNPLNYSSNEFYPERFTPAEGYYTCGDRSTVDQGSSKMTNLPSNQYNVYDTKQKLNDHILTPYGFDTGGIE